MSLLLDSMHASTALAMCFRLSAPFSIGKPHVEGIPIRVSEGAPYWLKVAQGDWMHVEPGDLVLLPHGDPHVMASDPAVPVVPLSQGFTELGLQEWVGPGREMPDPRVMSFGGPGALTTIVGGILVFRQAARFPFFEVLPPVIHIRATGRPMLARLGSAMQALLEEAKEAEPGWHIAVCRLAEAIFVQALRAHVALEREARPGWFEALGDPKIGRAIQLIHHDLANDWTVEKLATAVGMSRSRFAARFSELLGKSPMAYLSRARLSLAADKLARGGSVSAVAASCGYASEKAFSRAFGNWSGKPPAAYRRDTKNSS
nr:AraC family transcriptional regulator [Variovorax sp. dw_954]